MATVPTLTVGGVDQTAFIHRKTLVYKLKSLDFTLVDPVTNPALHNAVSVDDPEWHGRVSTIESYPMRAADGTDHRWVKITCTNKHTADPDTAPFGLSDIPDDVTTFPYKDFGYIQTLADQTDLASAEHRATGTVYEPGLLPGMTVEVTNDAEGLAAEEFVITEMTIEWLRDDVPEYHLEMSVEGDPPVTLGDLIASQGCDCPPFECEPTDYTVHADGGAEALACVINDAVDNDSCQSPNGPGDPMWLYDGATYRVDYLVFHNATSARKWARLSADRGAGSFDTDTRIDMGAPAFADDLVTATATFTVGSSTFDGIYCRAQLDCDPPGGGVENEPSSISAHITYLSGPDPRFSEPSCLDELPHSGQLVNDGVFTGDGSTVDYATDYPYGAGTLEVFVNGLDWTAQITESDPEAGDYALAYAPPLDSTVRPVYRGA